MKGQALVRLLLRSQARALQRKLDSELTLFTGLLGPFPENPIPLSYGTYLKSKY